VSEPIVGMSSFPVAETVCAKNTIFVRRFKAIGLFKPQSENISFFQKAKSGVWFAHPATDAMDASCSGALSKRADE
jgi:hypothetical protein